MGLVALALLVYGETGSPLATAGLFLSLSVVPAFLGPLLIARVDLVPVRRILPSIYAAEAVVFGALALLADHFVLAGMLALGVVDGTLALTGRAITRSAVGRVLEDPAQLRAGNGLMNASFAVAGICGAALGGVLVGALGASSALLIDAVSFLLIGLILAHTPNLPAPVRERDDRQARLREGIRYVTANPAVRLLVGGEALALMFFTLVVPVEVVYAVETLQTDEAGFGALLAAWSGGMLIGSVVFIAARRQSLRIVIAASTALIGVGYLGMAAVSGLIAACAFAAVGGVGNGVQWVSVLTAVQQATPADLQARVVGVLEALNRGMPTVGFVLGGALTALFSPAAALAVAGVGACVLALAAAALAGVTTTGPPGEP